MSTQTIPFRPRPAGTVNIDVSSSSQAVALVESGATQVRVMNDGTATAWINWGASGVTAAVATGVQGLAMGQSPPIPVLTCKQSNSQILVDILDVILATGGPHAKAINHQV